MWKPTVEINGLDNYSVHFLIPQNTESGEPELNNVGEKYQYMKDLILHKNIKNERWNQITDMIQGFEPPLLVHLENGTRMH